VRRIVVPPSTLSRDSKLIQDYESIKAEMSDQWWHSHWNLEFVSRPKINRHGEVVEGLFCVQAAINLGVPLVEVDVE
jgi:hypothetical protein